MSNACPRGEPKGAACQSEQRRKENMKLKPNLPVTPNICRPRAPVGGGTGAERQRLRLVPVLPHVEWWKLSIEGTTYSSVPF